MHLEANLTRLIEEHLVKTVEMERIQIDRDRLLGIDQDVLDLAITLILRIQLKVFHHIAQQDTRLDNLDLVVNTGGVREET